MRSVIIGAAMALIMSSAATAADFSTVIKDIDGKDVVDDFKCPPDPRTGARSCEDKLTLGRAVANALLQTVQGDDADARGKLDRWELARRVAHGGVVQLDAPDTTMVIKRIGAVYAPSVVGPAVSLLDPNFGKAK